ncbi:MAG: hypothetical protein HY686_00115 [Chloroflexi bacterium]|nr:hypothetical protein [Chloroflexota bacterium]
MLVGQAATRSPTVVERPGSGRGKGVDPWLVEIAALLAILALGFYVAMAPHLRYPYPLHVDEWEHFTYASFLAREGHLNYPGPFPIWGVTHPEPAFHVFLAQLHLVSGIPWLWLFQVFPGVLYVIIILAAYAIGRAEGVGLQAAFFSALLPSTLRLLGPTFLVPSTLALLMLLTQVLLLRRLLRHFSLPVFIASQLVIIFVVVLHPPAAAVLVMLTFLSMGLNALVHPRRVLLRLGMALLTLIPPLAALGALYLWDPSKVRDALSALPSSGTTPFGREIFPMALRYGYIPTALAILGVGWVVVRGAWEWYPPAIVVLVMITFIRAIYPRWLPTALEPLYERGWLFTLILMGIFAGLGLRAATGALRWMAARLRGKAAVGQALAWLLVAGLAVPAAWHTVQDRRAEEYYFLMEPKVYQDFIWVAERVPERYTLALLSPERAWVFPPFARRSVYAVTKWPYIDGKAKVTQEVLEQGVTDTGALITRGIRIVYTSIPLRNEDLIRVRDRLYLLPEKGAPGTPSGKPQ